MNYGNIARALEFFQARGYVYADDAPWTVELAAYYATKPTGAPDIMIQAGTNPHRYPVASGEQSFLQMMLDGQHVKRAICVTPCFRAEPRLDTLHRPYFMKAELINAHDVDEGHLIDMVADAREFFKQFLPVRVVKTEIGYDIVEKGQRFELGSYGIREVSRGRSGGMLRWIYGTACAEPRLSTAISKHLKNVGE